MAKTLEQIHKQIASLSKEAETIKRQEVAGVIDRIKEAIAVYGLTAGDLGFRGTPGPKKGTTSGAAKFADGKGNTWGGMGKRPTWLRNALAAGASLDQFRTNSAVQSVTPSKRAGKKKSASSKKAAVKYRDGAGNTWSGRGLQPRWLVAALQAGKKLDELRA